MERYDVVVVGGGAAGYFAAINCAETRPDFKILILERGKDVLNKVKISGGGRCNLTHNCHEPDELIKNYPRGSRELRGPFYEFGQPQTLDWFNKRGVKTKVESDGRMFPSTDKSQTIMDCLIASAKKAGVELQIGSRVSDLKPENELWKINLTHQKPIFAKKIMIAAGSSNGMWKVLENLGHKIIKPVPSLFTFNIKDPRIQGLMGTSVPGAHFSLISNFDKKARRKYQLESTGSLLVTHWGLSGFGVLRMSAWAARALAELNYKADLKVNWVHPLTIDEVTKKLTQLKSDWSKKTVQTQSPFSTISARLWKSFVNHALSGREKNWADLNKKEIAQLTENLSAAIFKIKGKSTFKEEFVTAGGVDLKEINFKKFESKIHPNLFMAGEILNIDAVTGGFNFQAAWTGGWIAGKAMAE